MKQIRLDHDPLSLVFERSIDRWSHRIVFNPDPMVQTFQHMAGERDASDSAARNPAASHSEPVRKGESLAITILNSVEGDSNEDWPPSPPIQEIEPHCRDMKANAVLGVGRAGKSHWSASFAPRIASPYEIQIELACLVGIHHSTKLIPLSSCYSISAEIEALRSESETGSIRLLGLGFELEISPLGGDNWNSELHLDGKQLLIHPTRILSEPRKPTRWGYRVKARAHAVT